MTVRQVQALLIYLGYDPGQPDGVAGTKTRQAVRSFQIDAGLTADGSPGPLTRAALLAAVTRGEMGKGSDFWEELHYFRRGESGIGCPCGRCGGFPVEPTETLMRLADRVREQAGVPMYPSSTVRCPDHNREVGGVADSRHLAGKAMDFRLADHTAAQTLALVSARPEVRYAYAIDERYVHMDVK